MVLTGVVSVLSVVIIILKIVVPSVDKSGYYSAELLNRIFHHQER